MANRDLLKFDVAGVQRLRSAAIGASHDLAADHAALIPLMNEAGVRLGRDQIVHLVALGRIRVALDKVAADITTRLVQVMATLVNARSIDDLSARIAGWDGSRNDPNLINLAIERDDLIRTLTGADETTALAVIALASAGMPVLDAMEEVVRSQREARIDHLIELEGIDRYTAMTRVAQIDATISALIVDSGLEPAEAVAALSISESLGLDLDAAVARADTDDIGVLEALGHMAIADNLGLTIDEAASISALHAHFASLDTAAGGGSDGRVSSADLEFVVTNPTRFAPAQIAAAEAILASPELLARIDTAARNDDVLSEDRFGDLSDGDGLISLDDLQAFVVKAQLNHVLGDYADQIDVAADAGGEVDGFVSRADLEAFLRDGPELPADVRAAATSMLDAGMFDRTWLADHRDELAMGAAIVAGAVAAGVVITVSAGTATPLVVMGMGAAAGTTAGATTTLTVNALDDSLDPFDDVVGNAARGGLLGATTAGLPLGFSAVGSATTLPLTLAAAAGVTSNIASIAGAGGVDILLPESIEDEVHSTASFISELTGPAAAFRG